MYRFEDEVIEVLLVHPGGPFNANKDLRAWSIPKGEFEPGEDIFQTAVREFHEELGSRVAGEFVLLQSVRQSGGKTVHAYAVEGDLDTDSFTSNLFQMEWPPRSGKFEDFPEVDRAEWFTIPTARQKINPAQTAFLDELLTRLA